MMRYCKLRQYSDHMYCVKCGQCYDMNDPDPPRCPRLILGAFVGVAVLWAVLIGLAVYAR
jgi:hypothetical protein